MANTLKDNRFLVITGLSGSGKTVVSRFLEDRGYYCVDNLPAKLIPDFVELWLKKKVEIDRVALVLDIREPHFLTEFPRVLREIRKRVPARLVFLDASRRGPRQALQRDPAAAPPEPPALHPRGRPARAAATGRGQEGGRRGHRHLEPEPLPAQGGHQPPGPPGPVPAHADRPHQLRLQVRHPPRLGPRLRHALPAQPVLCRPPAGPEREGQERPRLRPLLARDDRASSGSSSGSPTS